jgi:hypothetical protein
MPHIASERLLCQGKMECGAQKGGKIDLKIWKEGGI